MTMDPDKLWPRRADAANDGLDEDRDLDDLALTLDEDLPVDRVADDWAADADDRAVDFDDAEDRDAEDRDAEDRDADLDAKDYRS